MKHGRLIDAEKLKAHYAWWENGSEEYQTFKNLFDQIIDAQPTVHKASELCKGEIIKCHDEADMLHTYRDLDKAGYVTDFVYEFDGKKVTAIEILGRIYDD